MMFSRQNSAEALHIEGLRHQALHLARGRLVFISGVFVLLFIFMTARVIDLGLIKGYMVQQGQSRVENTVKQVSLKGNIKDRNGLLLATSLRTASLYVDPSLVAEPKKLAKSLDVLFPDLTYGEVLQKLQRSGRFVWLKRNISPKQQAAILQIGDPSLGFEYEYRRVYPQNGLMAHVVGYNNVDGKGLMGIERSFDGYLSEDQNDITLTLDVRLQHILRREVQKAVSDFKAIGGGGLILDTKTGEVLAMVSLPDFDPHQPASAADVQFNKMTQGVYELGSTFKIFSTAAYFETHDNAMQAEFDARKPIKRSGFTISDYHAEERVLSLPEVFMVSSNIGSALMGEAVGTENLRRFYSDLGLLSPLTLEITETAKPLVPEPWRDINTLTASYGHGIAVTPIQMVAAAASIVSDGSVVYPTLIAVDDESERSVQKSVHLQAVSKDTMHQIRRLMRLVVTEGTGGQADVPGYYVGGKTGTAEKIGASGGYDQKRIISSFLGVFPMNDPQYAVFVMVDEPKGTQKSFGYATGGWVAAPAVGRVVKAMGAVLGLAPQQASLEKNKGGRYNASY